MCGIAGFATADGKHFPVRDMNRSMIRRGPDGEGLESWPNATLGQRRLAIIDLSDAGRQPMLSEDGKIGLVFNGCIYNFMELRRELESQGQSFRSQCDTEVLLRGYAAWGTDQLVSKLRGMYAFAIWDERAGKLTLVRDRLGVKPLLYAMPGGSLVFASTVDALKAAGVVQDLDPEAVLEFLEFGFVTEERSIYREVHKLPPASILEWQGGKVAVRSYWSVPPIDENSRITFEEAVEETERLLLESVQLRLCADVPIGALLSAGVDSALVCWALRLLKADVKAFTVSTPNDPADESQDAAETARILGIPHEIVSLDEEQKAPLDEMVDAYGEPFACQSAAGMLRVSRAVKGRATVLLTGDGGDDVFLGYNFLFNAWQAQQLARQLPAFSSAAWNLARPVAGMIAPLRRVRNFLDYSTGGLGAYNRVREGLPYFQDHALMGDRLKSLRLAQRSIPPSSESARQLLWDVFNYHKKTHFLSEFMTKVDGGTMHHSIEARAPFLDHKIWEFASALPPHIRFEGGRRKAVLREIVARRVGPQVAQRKKQGFTIPIERWLAGEWKESMELLRSSTRLEQEGWIRRGALEGQISRALAGSEVPVQLWRLLVLEHWLRQKHHPMEVCV